MLKRVAVPVVVVVISPPFTAMSPLVVIFPVAPASVKLVEVISFEPRESAFTISGSDRSRAFIIPPAADCILIPENMGSLVSRFSTNTICPAGVGFEPLASENWLKLVEPAEAVALKLPSVSVRQHHNNCSRKRTNYRD